MGVFYGQLGGRRTDLGFIRVRDGARVRCRKLAVDLDVSFDFGDIKRQRPRRERLGDLPTLLVREVLPLKNILDTVDQIADVLAGVRDTVATVPVEQLAGFPYRAIPMLVSLTGPDTNRVRDVVIPGHIVNTNRESRLFYPTDSGLTYKRRSDGGGCRCRSAS